MRGLMQPGCPIFLGQESTGCLPRPPGKEWMAQTMAADPHHGRTFILCVGAIGRPRAAGQAVMTWDIRPS